MFSNNSTESDSRSELSAKDISQKKLSVTASIISMTVGILSNSLAIFILVKSYKRIRIKSRASFLLFASGLVVTDLLGHLINGSLVLSVYSFNKKWKTFDPQGIVCNTFGASLVFFGLSPLFLGSIMAVERCIGITKPIFHSTVFAHHHMKKLLVLTWTLVAVVAWLPVMLGRPYKVQISRSFCFFHLQEPSDWVDVFLPLLFSVLGLLTLLISILCNTVTSCALLRLRLCKKRRSNGTSYHIEMICQLLAIMLVSCNCWGPLLIHVIVESAKTRHDPTSLTLLTVIRMATWNQILDPWVYILLRRAVLRKIFTFIHCCWGPKMRETHRWQCNALRSSLDTSTSGNTQVLCHCNGTLAPSDVVIKSIT
ncbi:prostaglandin F2-alpha receptor [Cynoglossus semilaevis]|uniref:Prostaglandin F2-alpha receptor n=1 Tax=Cynoglossus semilaevis TaxID=244447 RepID=A0A3P8X0N0_CYNSE|nr:prostaglandin F2-alpha receptor [Cynoglossus semilaevis]XP_024909723.1 prostaglandin F2-alpha receptor [Cynoglossus semilaevis]